MPVIAWHNKTSSASGRGVCHGTMGISIGLPWAAVTKFWPAFPFGSHYILTSISIRQSLHSDQHFHTAVTTFWPAFLFGSHYILTSISIRQSLHSDQHFHTAVTTFWPAFPIQRSLHSNQHFHTAVTTFWPAFPFGSHYILTSISIRRSLHSDQHFHTAVTIFWQAFPYGRHYILTSISIRQSLHSDQHFHTAVTTFWPAFPYGSHYILTSISIRPSLHSDQHFHTRDKSLYFELCLNTDIPFWEQPSESSFGSLWGISWGRRNKLTSGSVCFLWGTRWVWSNRSALTSNTSNYTTSNGTSPIDETWFPLMGNKLRILAVPISPERTLLVPSTIYQVQRRYNYLSSRRYVQCAINKPYLIR
jgi:hypothetical protein